MKSIRFLRVLSTKSFNTSKTVLTRTVSLLACNRRVGKSSTHLLNQSDILQIKPCHLASYVSLARQPGSEASVAAVTVDTSRKNCLITWEDGFISQFHSAWLRHNCHCEECRHPNGQKLLNPSDVSPSLVIVSAVIQGSSLIVKLEGMDDSHTVQIPTSFLRSHNYNSHTILDRRVQKRPEPASEIPFISYKDIISSEGCLYRWVRHINEEGICIIKDVPLREDMVQKVVEMMGPIMPTIYGSTFDVEETPEQINVAYSNLPIGLHQDLVYFESPPGLQLLHCLEFDDCVEGGDNIFLDAFHMADKFRAAYPDLFQTLTKVPATFQKVHYHRDLPVHVVNQKPHIKVNHFGEICAVYWAPPFEGPLAVEMLKHRLRPGDLVVFNNLRMLHGRDGFESNGGARRLRGCYLNIDMFKSHIQVLHNLEGDGRLAKRVGNQCWF